MDEVADVVGQEDGGAGHAGPHRLRVVPHGDIELLVVGPLFHRRGEVEGRDAQDARELPGLLTADHAGRTVGLAGDLVHGGMLALEQHVGGVA